MKNKMPTISVIIPTYNRENFVIKAINSVLSQKYKDYEIIVVDDGSEDNTNQILNSMGDKIRYIYQENAGVSAARNRGINCAKGEWVSFLDSDDEWRPDFLLKQMEKVNQNQNICMQTTDCLFIGLNGESRRYFEINGALNAFCGKDYLIYKNPFRFVVKHGPWQIGGTIIRREAIEKAGLFDRSLKISEDFDLMARVALQGPFGMIREALVNVYRRDESVVCLTSQAKDNPIRARESDGRIYEKLKQIEILSDKERKALIELLSANRRAIGNLLIKKGDVRAARNYYKRAFFISPSLVSLSKYILSFLPAKTNLG